MINVGDRVVYKINDPTDRRQGKEGTVLSQETSLSNPWHWVKFDGLDGEWDCWGDQLTVVAPKPAVNDTVRITIEGKVTAVDGIWLQVDYEWHTLGPSKHVEVLAPPLPEIPTGCEGLVTKDGTIYKYQPELSGKDHPFGGHSLKYFVEMNKFKGFLVLHES